MDPSDNALFLQGVLHDEGVYDGGEHPCVVSSSPIHAVGCGVGATPDVAAANDHSYLAVGGLGFLYLARNEGDGGVVDAKTLTAGEGLATDLDEEAAIFGVGGRRHLPISNLVKRRTWMFSRTWPMVSLTRSWTVLEGSLMKVWERRAASSGE